MAAISNADFSDMQGLLRFGYGKMTEASYLLLNITDPAKAATWLAHAEVATAETKSPPPRSAMQIAFTAQGLQRLGVPEQIMNGFSAEFLSGMCGETNRSRRLGDVGENAPAYWLWGNPSALPDLVVLLYAHKDQFQQWVESIKFQLNEFGCTILQRLDTNDMGDIEPFGFADGISSPVIDWDQKRDPSGDKLDYENVSMVGEFILGYPNEYGLYTTRPTIDDATADLPSVDSSSDVKDLGRNGSYLVFRQIDQDVHGFWQYLSSQSGNDHSSTTELAEQLVGRRMSGEPLVETTQKTIIGVGPDANDLRLNGFDYSHDSNGFSCPIGAHIRRANPRNADLPSGTSDSRWGKLSRTLALDRLLGHDELDRDRDRVASTRFHRLLRRGREYGPLLNQEQRMEPATPGEASSGLHFISLGANIGRQFEFVQSAWLHNSAFDGLSDENDPLTGNRETVEGCPAANFTIQVKGGVRKRLHNIPNFTKIRGGAYFFLPGVRALRYIARTCK